jgi:3-hydroxyacyl-CoA dehydrogenase / enoyl-CoA hydratase / 3-hydroxybutyryl-CoA epimerase
MPDDFQNLRLERDTRGVVTVTLDVKDSPVNIFSESLFAEFREVVTRLESEPPKVLVFRSGKPTGFMAGADVKQIRRLGTADEVRAVIDAGHDLFARIERLPCSSVAVIFGACLGGGLEFALSCRYRIARDDPSTKIGLPEVQLGLIPGWGGTQRLPRLVGLRQALRIILEGASLSAAKAAKAGLIDLAVTPSEFDATVERFIEDRIAGKEVSRPSRGMVGYLLEGTAPGRAIVLATARKKIQKRGEHYPALPAALRAVEAGYKGDQQAGFTAEREEFVKVVFTHASRNLIELFFQREKARKPSTWVANDIRPRKTQRAAVLGAGTMGAGIAQLLAVNGTPVVLKEINDDLVKAGMKKIETLTNEAAAKGVITRADAEKALGAIVPTSEWGPLDGADLAIEAVVEREDVKRDVFKQLAEKLGSGAVLASNTSALSITRLAETTPHPERVAGLHFFNPVHKMQLVEVVRAPNTNDETIATLVDLVRKLGKVPVVVADSPGFLVNRILFPYLDEAVRQVIEGVSGADVDAAAKKFGMPMGPLELLDQIGIDIAADVSKTFAAMSTDVGPTPQHFTEMVKDGALGMKAGRGFYEYPSGEKGNPTRWGTPTQPRAISPPNASGEFSPVQRRLIYPIINEAAKCLESGVVSEPWVVDLAMVLGTGFAPFRGGPLRTADAIGIAQLVGELNNLQRDLGPRFEPCSLLRTMAAEERGFYDDKPRKVEHQELSR